MKEKFLLLIVMFLLVSNAYAGQKWEIIPPSPCYKVKEIKENNVYLITDESCKTAGEFIEVEIDSKYKEVNVYADDVFFRKQTVNDVKVTELIKTYKEAKEKGEKIKPESFKNKHEEEAKKEAEKAYSYYQSEEFQRNYKKFKEQMEHLLLQQGGYSSSDFINPYKDMSTLGKIKLNQDERIYILVSSSIPEVTIKNYIKQSLKFSNNIFFVLRGGINGLTKVQPTVSWIFNLIKKNQYCEDTSCEVYPVKFLIDPFIFKKYEVKKVPAVVYARGLPDINVITESEGTLNPSFSVVSIGDVSLEYHLKIMAEKTQDKRLEKILSELRR